MLIEFFDILLGIALAITGSLTFWPVTHGYDFYIPIVLFIAGYVAGFAFMFCLYWLASLFAKKYKKGEARPSKWSRFWFTNGAWFICFHAHVILSIKDKNKVPTNKRFLLVCNHRSKFDPMLTEAYFTRRKIAFITKQDNLKIPLARAFMPGMCYMGIDRDDKLQSLEVMKKSIALISNNEASVGVYPEGKRNYGVDVGEFHEGVFNIAIHAKCPIVVMTIQGTENISKRYPRFTKVKMIIEGVLPYESFEGQTAKAVSDMVHGIMKERLSK